ADTVSACHALARGGFLFGGSTGTVVSGALRWLAEHRPGENGTAVAIAPDLGERYLDTVYQQSWVREVYGLEPTGLSTGAAQSCPPPPLPPGSCRSPPPSARCGTGSRPTRATPSSPWATSWSCAAPWTPPASRPPGSACCGRPAPSAP